MDRITIDKSYFDTLLRRAETNFILPPAKHDTPTVTIKSSEYTDLVRQASEYQKLRHALLQNGVSIDAINVLICGHAGQNGTDQVQASSADWADDHIPLHQTSSNDPLDTTQLPGNFAYVRNSDKSAVLRNGNPRMNGNFPSSSMNFQQNSMDDSGMAPIGLDFLDEEENRPWNETAQRTGARQDHTLALSNLPDGVTLKDIIKVVKGGRLVEMYLRRQEHKAVITFMDGAAEFLAYAKRNDIYIGSKRIEISWSDRQFVIAPHLAVKLAHGATRNIIVRGVAHKVNEVDIREHLDHIHNLIIVAIVWLGADAVISTNSVNNAMFARTCMKSRAIYKGLSIEWYPDECEVPLPRPMVQRNRNVPPATPVSKYRVTNRFNLLDLDGKSDGGSDLTVDDGNTSSAGIDLSPRSQATTAVVY